MCPDFFLHRLLIGGAQISLLCTLLNLVHSGTSSMGSFQALSGSGTNVTIQVGQESIDTHNNWRNLNVWSMIFKARALSFVCLFHFSFARSVAFALTSDAFEPTGLRCAVPPQQPGMARMSAHHEPG
tara:strand:- start:35 stop:415 length:381 start_codon:yes stop_codon:yes gene_type:complete